MKSFSTTSSFVIIINKNVMFNKKKSRALQICDNTFFVYNKTLQVFQNIVHRNYYRDHSYFRSLFLQEKRGKQNKILKLSGDDNSKHTKIPKRNKMKKRNTYCF